MKRDFDRNLQDLSKQSLKIKGQEFVLDAQIKIIKEQTQRLKNEENEFREGKQMLHGDLNRNKSDNGKQNNALDAELRSLHDHGNQAETTHYEHKIHQDKETAFDEEYLNRHDLEVKLVTALKDRKQKELD